MTENSSTDLAIVPVFIPLSYLYDRKTTLLFFVFMSAFAMALLEAGPEKGIADLSIIGFHTVYFLPAMGLVILSAAWCFGRYHYRRIQYRLFDDRLTICERLFSGQCITVVKFSDLNSLVERRNCFQKKSHTSNLIIKANSGVGGIASNGTSLLAGLPAIFRSAGSGSGIENS